MQSSREIDPYSYFRFRISWEIVPCLGNRNLRGGNQLDQLLSDGRVSCISLPPPLVSDRSLCSFGSPRNNVQEGVVWIGAFARSPDTLLERIVVRHYKLVTDVSLRHLAGCSPNLKLLDVTGTSVTQEGVEVFKAIKPDCTVLSDF